MLPRDRLAVRVESRRDLVVVVRPEHIVLYVFFARPEYLDGRAHLLADLQRLGRHVEFQPTSETAAEQMVMDGDLLCRQAGDFHGRIDDARRHLCAQPDIAAVRSHVHRAVDRFHRGVGEERLLIDRIDACLGVRETLRDVAVLARYGTVAVICRGAEIVDDLLHRKTRARAFIPGDLQRCKAALGGPRVIADNSYRVVGLDDLTYTGNLFGIGVVDAA